MHIECHATLGWLIGNVLAKDRTLRNYAVVGAILPDIDAIPYVKINEALPGAVRRLLDVMPVLKPVIPDPGVPFQLVHHDDVATAMRAAVQGRGTPGIYNLAGDGTLTMSDLASELGWYAIPVPDHM